MNPNQAPSTGKILQLRLPLLEIEQQICSEHDLSVILLGQFHGGCSTVDYGLAFLGSF